MAELMHGKNVLVMGVANRWSLAYAIAEALAREGARLALTYQAERVRRSVEELAHGLGAAAVLPCEVTDDAALAALFEALAREPGSLHGVVHSLAFAQKEDLDRPFAQTSRAGFQQALEVSAYSLVSVARSAAPLMAGGGSIVTLSYLGAQRVVPNYNVMGVAKAGLEACVRYLASELGPAGIRVNAISAGPVKTASARAIRNFNSILDLVAERAPLRRVPAPAEVADAALFLLSDLGRGVTGDTLYVDAGYHIMGV
ncbi:MAG: enoyl-ACP reductase FabI [Terriglobales bacterium]